MNPDTNRPAIVVTILGSGTCVPSLQRSSCALLVETRGAQLLLDAGADVNMIDGNEHFTALMWAAAEGQAENVQLLLEHGAEVLGLDLDTRAVTACQQAQMDMGFAELPGCNTNPDSCAFSIMRSVSSRSISRAMPLWI